MNWVDIVILLILAAFAYHGWLRGFILTALDLVGMILSLVAAILLYPFFGGLLQRWGLERAVANSFAFIGVFLVVEAAFWAFGRRLYQSLPRSAETSPVNHAFGVIPGMIKGALFVWLLILILLNTPLGISPESIENSFIGRLFLGAGSAIRQSTASILPRDIGKDFEFQTIEPGSDESVEIAVDKNAELDPQAEQAMLKLLNEDRVENGLKPLKPDPKLQAVARAHSRDMFYRGYFAHVSPDGQDPFDRMRKAKIGFIRAGENLALAPSASIAQTGLMNSPGHRRNILDPHFRRVGIGTYSGGPFRKTFSQEFTN